MNDDPPTSSPTPPREHVAVSIPSLPPTRPAASTWPGAIVDGIALMGVVLLAVLGRVDPMVAVLILAFVLGVRVPIRRGGALLTLVSPALDLLRWRS